MASQTPDDFQDDRVSRIVFVGSPSRETTPDTFVNDSEEYGQITDSLITRDRETGMSRGFGKQVPPAYNIHPSGYPCSDSFKRHASYRSMRPSFVGVFPRDTFMEHSDEHYGVMRRDTETGMSRLTYADPSVVDTVITQAHTKNGEQSEVKNAESKTSLNPNPGKSDDDDDDDNEIFDTSFYYKPCRMFQEFFKPRKGWVKLNIRSRLVDAVGIGGIVRNESGDWVTGFYRRVKDGVESVELDLLVLKEGISLAAVIDKKLEIETDSQELSFLMKDEASDSIIDDLPQLLPLVKECRHLLTKLKNYKFIFRLGGGISATFKLAVMGSQLEHMNLVILDAPPEDIHHILVGEIA